RPRGADGGDGDPGRDHAGGEIGSDRGEQADLEPEPPSGERNIVGGAAGPDAGGRLVEGDVAYGHQIHDGSPLLGPERAWPGRAAELQLHLLGDDLLHDLGGAAEIMKEIIAKQM